MASHVKREPSIAESAIIKWRLLASGKFTLPSSSNTELLLIPLHQCAAQSGSRSHREVSINLQHGHGAASSPSPSCE